MLESLELSCIAHTAIAEKEAAAEAEAAVVAKGKKPDKGKKGAEVEELVVPPVEVRASLILYPSLFRP